MLKVGADKFLIGVAVIWQLKEIQNTRLSFREVLDGFGSIVRGLGIGVSSVGFHHFPLALSAALNLITS